MGNRKRINAIRLQPVIANDKQMIANIHVLVKLLNIDCSEAIVIA
jgi:hypothetical protein